jgi:hypothetical protein
MKITVAILLVFLIVTKGFAQDTVRVQTVRVDTVKVETVRVDTVFVQPVTVQPAPAEQAVQPDVKPLLNYNKLYFGGYIGATFGSYTSVSVEPLVGYQLTKRLSLGGKFSYEYISDKRYDVDYSASNYGLSIFSRINLTQRLYSHFEYSAMNYKMYDEFGESERTWVPFLYIGGGIFQPISRNTAFYVEVLFDVLQNENSPYADWEPFFSVGFTVSR